MIMNRRGPWEVGKAVEGTPYRVLSVLGSGGMGCVYDVEHMELGRTFVAKALHPHLLSRDDLVGRMRNEWRTLGALNHPNIVPVTDAGSTSLGVPFFVMEKLAGQTFFDLAKGKNRLGILETVQATIDVLSGLNAAHAMGIVHRDIKPQNLFLAENGRAYILDFGIAQLRERHAKVITENGIAIGTPRFMAPEQAEGKKVDGRADIYATGLVVFEMLAGKGPFFHIRDPNQLVLAQINEPAPRLDDVIPWCPPELADIIQHWLGKRPDHRPLNARHAADELIGLIPLLTKLQDTTELPTAEHHYEALTIKPNPLTARSIISEEISNQEAPAAGFIPSGQASSPPSMAHTQTLSNLNLGPVSLQLEPSTKLPTWLKLRTHWERPKAQPSASTRPYRGLNVQSKKKPPILKQLLIGLCLAGLSFCVVWQTAPAPQATSLESVANDIEKAPGLNECCLKPVKIPSEAIVPIEAKVFARKEYNGPSLLETHESEAKDVIIPQLVKSQTHALTDKKALYDLSFSPGTNEPLLKNKKKTTVRQLAPKKKQKKIKAQALPSLPRSGL